MADRLKDRFFQRPFLEGLATEIAAVHPGFDRARFFRLVYDRERERLELKARMRHVTEALGQTLPADFRDALRILLAVEQGRSASTTPARTWRRSS